MFEYKRTIIQMFPIFLDSRGLIWNIMPNLTLPFPYWYYQVSSGDQLKEGEIHLTMDNPQLNPMWLNSSTVVETKIVAKVENQQEIDHSEKKVPRRAQNPFRNIYTNLVNLVLNFMICRRKVGNLLKDIDWSLEGDKLRRFTKYIMDLKKYFHSYFNSQKAFKLIQGTSIQFYDKDFHRIFRIAAKVLLERKIPSCLLTSRKMSSLLRIEHFKVLRLILRMLKQNQPEDTD